MILKRLKLFTIYVGPNGVAASDTQLRNLASRSAVNNAGQLGLPDYTNKLNGANAGNASTGSNTGSNANTNASSANTGNGGGSNTTNAGNNGSVNTGSNTANNANAAGNNGANSGSVMQKQTYDKSGVSTNNVKADTAQAYNKEQLDNLNKAHKQELNNRYAQGAKRGEQAGMRKAGVWQGLKNTWRNAGTMKKIGMGGAALAGTYFLGKGLLGGNNNNDQQ